MNKKVKCYNCGKELGENEVTKEHIPARTLFDGYTDRYKKNRITVPACFECNNFYSFTDENFRNLIGIIATQEGNNVIAEKSIKSILRKKSEYSRLNFYNGEVVGVDFNEQKIIEFHKKNFKGLFYHQYGFPLTKDYELVVNINENDNTEFTLCVIGYLKDFFEWKYSGHKNILSYCIQPFRLDITNRDKKDLELSVNEDIIVGILVYNQEHTALVYAINKEYKKFKQINNKP